MPRKLTSVVNIRTNSCDVYIGRGSKWGNPFKIGVDGTRADVITKYIENFSGELLNAIISGELDGKRLGCYCKPQACHGDFLATLANNKLE